MKALVYVPAGQVYDKDKVRWAKPKTGDLNFIRKYMNSGDCLVFDSSLKVLAYDTVETLELGRLSRDPEYLEYCNTEFSYCFIRGSNFLRPSVDWGPTVRNFELLDMPVIALGVGAQAFQEERLPLPENMKRAFSIIAEKSYSVGVRGRYSAEVFNDFGIKNVEIIGCPSMFRHGDPDLEITLKPLDQINKVGFTLRREHIEHFAVNRFYFDFQRHLINELRSRYQVDVLSQGEVPEKILSGYAVPYVTPEQNQTLVEEAVSKLLADGWYNPDNSDQEFREWYAASVRYQDDMAEMDRIQQDFDLVLGCRLHGNTAAMASGRPAIYLLNDTRIREFAETFDVPRHDIFTYKPFRLEDYYHQELFDRFNFQYKIMYDKMRTFLERNAVPHRMKDRRKEPAARAALVSA